MPDRTAITPVRILNWLSLAFLALVAGAVLLFLGVGTLFFDDPHADYGEFFRWATTPLDVAVLAVVAGQAGSRWLARGGRMWPAVLVAALPAPVTIGVIAYLWNWPS